MKKATVVFILTLVFALINSLFACTIFISSNEKQVLIGNNEDYTPDTRTFLWARPQEKGKNGYIFWGFEEKYPEGGMNDKGLFYDAASLPEKVNLIKNPDKPDFEGYIVEKILQECSSVTEVINWVSQYNLTWYEKAQIMVADKSGDYAIINASYIIRPNTSKYVLTNYNLHDINNQNFKCWRRNTASQLLMDQPASVDLFTRVLKQTTQNETDNQTLYSQVCDLKNGFIYLYQKRDFSKTKQIDISEILKNGRQDLEIKTMFPERYTEKLKTIYKQNGIEKTLIAYKKTKKLKGKDYSCSEKDILDLGYQLIDSNKVIDAIKLFDLNLKYYPNSEHTNVALANAYLIAGKKSTANKLYQKVSKINPLNFYVNLFGKRSDSLTFRIRGMQGAGKISLVGSFNNYQPNSNLFTKNDDEWICTIKIPPGDYSYKLYVDDRYWMQDPSNQLHIKPTEWWDSYLKVQ